MVCISHTVSNPKAVMVVSKHAYLALITVSGPVRTFKLTYFAIKLLWPIRFSISFGLILVLTAF